MNNSGPPITDGSIINCVDVWVATSPFQVVVEKLEHKLEVLSYLYGLICTVLVECKQLL